MGIRAVLREDLRRLMVSTPVPPPGILMSSTIASGGGVLSANITACMASKTGMTS